MQWMGIIRVTSIFLLLLAAAMLLPLVIDLLTHRSETINFLTATLITAVSGGLGYLVSRQKEERKLDLRSGFMLISLTWVVIPFYAALPLWFSSEVTSFQDAIFESVSGLTTTGATVLVGLDNMHEGLLLWRSLLQWLGGIGVVLMAVVMLPRLGVGGMQLFRQEITDRNEKAMPRANQITSWIVLLYVGLSLACGVAYKISGMSDFDAVNHAMTTISTGGFSTRDSSFYHFTGTAIPWIAMLFMVLSSLPFVLLVLTVRGRPSRLYNDEQVRFFLILLATLLALMVVHTLTLRGWNELYAVTEEVGFNVISLVTGTGYASSSYDQWGGMSVPFFFSIMVIGGCAGSTTCGIKIFRFVVLKESARVQLQRLLTPNGVFLSYYNGKPIEETVSDSVQGFFLLFGVSFVLLAWGLSMTGLDFLTAFSASASAIANVGPGLGDQIGPAGNFADFTVIAKWIMVVGMLVGRVEIYTMLLIFLPMFWND